MSAKPTTRGTIVWVAAVVLVSGVLAVVSGLTTLGVMSRAVVPEVVWQAGGGAPVPDDFVVVMFPADDDVAVYAEADGASERIGVLGRALGNRVRELDQDWIYVNAVGSGGYVRRSDLALVPPTGRLDPLFEALRASEAERGIEPRVRDLEAITLTTGGVGFRARVGWEGGSWDEYRWDIVGGGASPQSVLRWHEQTVAFEGLGAVVMSAVVMVTVFAGCALVGVVGVLVVRYRRRTVPVGGV